MRSRLPSSCPEGRARQPPPGHTSPASQRLEVGMIAPRDWPHVHRVNRRHAVVACVLGAVACLAALCLLLVGGRGRAAAPTVHGVPRFVADQLGREAHRTPAVATRAFAARVTAGGLVAHGAGADIALTTAQTGRWHPYAHGAVRRTTFGRETIVVGHASIEELSTVDRRLGARTWRWNLGNLTLNPSLTADGRVRFGGSTLHLEPVEILDAHGRNVTPGGSRWALRQAGSTWWLELKLDDAELPLPYTIDPLTINSWTGTRQTAGSTATYTLSVGTSSG